MRKTETGNSKIENRGDADFQISIFVFRPFLAHLQQDLQCRSLVQILEGLNSQFQRKRFGDQMVNRHVLPPEQLESRAQRPRNGNRAG